MACLPLVQIELKKRGVAIREAFNQVHRYSKESFNSDNSLYKYLQLFVITNGTDSRYFPNTTERNKNSFDFTMHWAKSNNSLIKDLKVFTATFFQKNTLLNVLLQYSVFDVNNALLVMRPYQIAATERILWKVKSAFEAKNWSKPESGGYIWHTTGSGKTLTSFKAARLATERMVQDYRSTYNDIRDWLRREKTTNEKDKATLIEEVRRMIRASLGNRAKESLIVDFINQTYHDKMDDKASIIDAFFTFAQTEQQREAEALINAEKLDSETAKRYITTSLKQEFASDNGTELNTILPKMSPLNPQYLTKKQTVFQKITAFVEKFKGVGGQV